MVTGHFLVQLTHCSVERQVSVLLVHVVNSSSGLIFENDSKSFNIVWSSFEDFIN